MRSSRSARLGIIGSGFGRYVHEPAFKKNKVAAVRSAGSKDWKGLISDPSLNLLSVAVPPKHQPRIALDAIRRKKALFLEKPLALDARQARRVWRAAAAARVPVMVDFEFTGIRAWQRARAAVQSGIVGRVHTLLVHWQMQTYVNQTGKKSWKSDSLAGGGVLLQFASHSLHYLEWMNGPIRRLYCRTAGSPNADGKGETFAHLSFVFKNGSAGSALIDTDAPNGAGHRVEFFGDKGSLALFNPDPKHALVFELDRTLPDGRVRKILRSGSGSKASHDGRIPPVSVLTGRLLRWMRTGRRQSPDLAEAVRTQVLLDAARRSSRTGRWVSTP